MSALDRGEQFGNVVGSVLVPILLAWLIVKGYEKLKKRKMGRRRMVIALVGVILFILGLVGNSVERSGTA